MASTVTLGKSATAVIVGAQNAIPMMEGMVPKFANAASGFTKSEVMSMGSTLPIHLARSHATKGLQVISLRSVPLNGRRAMFIPGWRCPE